MKKQNTGRKNPRIRTWLILVVLVTAAVAIGA